MRIHGTFVVIWEIFILSSISFSLHVQARANGIVSIRIPHNLISDWAGNLLVEDLTEQIDVRESEIAIQNIQMVFTAGKSMQPWATILFNSNVVIEECSETQAIVVTSLSTNSIASTVRITINDS